MKQSLRARRMDRHHKRSKGQGKLSLVSLMDIFTILVFFLLVNSSEVEVLQTHESIDLPKSVADQKPESTLVVMVNDDSILVNGRKVADTEDVMRSDSEEITPLKEELNYRASRRPFTSDEQRAQGRDVTIMGDQSIPYSLLKKVMATLAETDYRNISLAVSRIAGDTGDGAVQVNPAAVEG
jgi:biopolymer transport protein ExbD